MEKLIQMFQVAQEEASALAVVALGLLLAAYTVLGLVGLFWIRRGGLAIC
ncbi:MAG TPA: hypothetical protein VEC99_12455 [Clostridia bacterium]|nr:hypothetical protein [Clostridia bacterium]